MAILYKKLGIPSKTLENYKAALEIRK
jgi:hypothetical protein